MSHCLRISFTLDGSKNFLQTFVQKHARALMLEGTAQAEPENVVKIIVCGKRENIDQFVDLLHQQAAQDKVKNLELEPFISDKDFRGVFRVIE